MNRVLIILSSLSCIAAFAVQSACAQSTSSTGEADYLKTVQYLFERKVLAQAARTVYYDSTGAAYTEADPSMATADFRPAPLTLGLRGGQIQGPGDDSIPCVHQAFLGDALIDGGEYKLASDTLRGYIERCYADSESWRAFSRLGSAYGGLWSQLNFDSTRNPYPSYQ
jgi:hypothetical protein